MPATDSEPTRERRGFWRAQVQGINVEVHYWWICILALSAAAPIQDFHPAATQPILPPLVPWNGKSRALAVDPSDRWATPCERSNFRLSPSYDDTVAWLKELTSAAPKQLAMVSLGKTPEGRDLWMVIASSDGAFTRDAIRATGKPIFLAQAGIHPGEIDGKDAGMMLLRDMTVRGTKKELLDRAIFLFVPIFNIDGHERSSPFTRSNQRGPEITGWRTNSRNLNFNRDYAKLDTPEMRAMVKAIDDYDPDLYFDIHVTDGADYQSDITFGANGPHAHSPSINTWLRDSLTPRLNKDLTDAGHTPGVLVFERDPIEFSKGLREMTAPPRYSHGYGDARHVPSMLIENHALKPYDRRVLGTYVLLESAMRALGENGKAVRDAIAKDRAARPSSINLDFTDADGPPETIDFPGIEYRVVPSSITGSVRVEWLGKPVAMRLPYVRTTKPVATVTRPKAYWIPPAWNDVIERLKAHGILMEAIDSPREIDAVMYRLTEPKLATEAFEGHVGLTCTPVVEKRRERFPAGSVRVSTDQPLGDLVALLLEPSSSDSFVQWGFFNEVLQRTEYMDGYILEPMAERMLKEDPKLAAEFTAKLANDKDFASSPTKRLEWFYARTPFFDERWRLYPVAREE